MLVFPYQLAMTRLSGFNSAPRRLIDRDGNLRRTLEWLLTAKWPRRRLPTSPKRRSGVTLRLSGPCSYATQSSSDEVEAKFDKGVLEITAAKKSEAVKAQRKIEIQRSS